MVVCWVFGSFSESVGFELVLGLVFRGLFYFSDDSSLKVLRQFKPFK